LEARERLVERLVCRRHCRWFKEARKDPGRCGGFRYIAGLLAADERLVARLEGLGPGTLAGLPLEPGLREILCAPCPFREDGCDFAAGESAPPCGGLLAAQALDEL
jgi:hypothetical protein